MLFKRKTGFQIYEGQATGEISDDSKIVDISDDPNQKAVITSNHIFGGGDIEASGSLDPVPLPDGYTNASYLHVTIVTTGRIYIDTTSPDHSASTIFCYGTEDNPGMHQICEKITTITIRNPSTTDTVKVALAMVQLPDISDEDNFRGLQEDGTQTAMG